MRYAKASTKCSKCGEKDRVAGQRYCKGCRGCGAGSAEAEERRVFEAGCVPGGGAGRADQRTEREIAMRRFVVVATMRRGVLDVPEPLDDAGQTAAFARLAREEDPGSRRLPMYGGNENRVIWSHGRPLVNGRYESRPYVERMMRIAEKMAS